MIRDIKFRAWNKEKNIMVYNDEDSSAEYFDGVCLSNIQMVNSIFKTDFNEYEWMQYTGLKDKNGKKIFEGDILLYDSGSKTSVFYKNGAFVRSYGNSNMYLLYDSFIEDYYLYNYEVIGNIYENSDLISEVTKDEN